MDTPQLKGDRRATSVVALVKWVVLLGLVLFHVVSSDADIQHLILHILGIAAK
jgi:hypothetical protein